jgi:hypothetical protein
MARTGHDARVRDEFTRQAESFARSPALGSRDLLDPIRSALAKAAAGRILDLAAGPGIVSQALAGEARGVLVVLDLLPPDDPADAALLTALERLRDPSHARTLALGELRSLFTGAGLELVHEQTFSLARRFAEWASIISDPVRMESLEVVLRELVRRGADAGIGLREEDGELCFDNRFAVLAGRRRDPSVAA